MHQDNLHPDLFNWQIGDSRRSMTAFRFSLPFVAFAIGALVAMFGGNAWIMPASVLCAGALMCFGFLWRSQSNVMRMQKNDEIDAAIGRLLEEVALQHTELLIEDRRRFCLQARRITFDVLKKYGLIRQMASVQVAELAVLVFNDLVWEFKKSH